MASASNPRVKQARSLQSAGGRKKSGLVLLEGLRLCCDALEAALDGGERSGVALPESVLVDPGCLASSPEGRRLEALLLRLPFGRVALAAAPEVLAAASTTETPQGVVAILPRPLRPWDHWSRLILVLDGVKGPLLAVFCIANFACTEQNLTASLLHTLLAAPDPGNLGTLVRSAAACGVGGVLLVGPCTDPWAPKVQLPPAPLAAETLTFLHGVLLYEFL